MAFELGITQPSYSRLEKDDERITIPRLIAIAKLLNISVGELINEKVSKTINQHNNENLQTYIDLIIKADKEHIQTLKDEVNFLKNQLLK